MGYRNVLGISAVDEQENYDGEKQPITIDETETEITHSVLIYGVKNSTIKVGGKINTVSMSTFHSEISTNGKITVRGRDSF